VAISSDDDTDSIEYDSEHDCTVDMHMEDDVDAPDGVDLDGDVDMERDGDNEEEQDEEEQDEEEQDEEEEDEDEDDGKEPRTIGQGEMVNTLGNDVDTMVDDQPIMLPEKGQEMRQHTTQSQLLLPASRPQTPEPRPRRRTLETNPITGLEHLGRCDAARTSPGSANCVRS